MTISDEIFLARKKAGEVEKKIRLIMDEKGISVYRMALKLGICYDSARQSLTVFKRPLRSHELVEIIRFLGIGIEDL